MKVFNLPANLKFIPQVQKFQLFTFCNIYAPLFLLNVHLKTISNISAT